MTRDRKVDAAYLRVESRPIAGCEPWKRLAVQCPRQGSIGIEACVDCARLIDVVLDPETNEMVLLCESEPPVARRHALRLVGSEPQVCELELEPVSTLLPPQNICLRPELGAREVAALFVSRDIEHLPVVDERARPVGVLSKSELLAWRSRATGLCPTVREIMGPLGNCLSRTTSIARAAAALVASRLDYVVVVSPSGSVAGVLSASNLLSVCARPVDG